MCRTTFSLVRTPLTTGTFTFVGMTLEQSSDFSVRISSDHAPYRSPDEDATTISAPLPVPEWYGSLSGTIHYNYDSNAFAPLPGTIDISKTAPAIGYSNWHATGSTIGLANGTANGPAVVGYTSGYTSGYINGWVGTQTTTIMSLCSSTLCPSYDNHNIGHATNYRVYHHVDPTAKSSQNLLRNFRETKKKSV